MIFKTDFKLKTTIIAIFALIVIATACVACLSCTNDTIEKSDDTSYLTQWVDTGLPVVRIDTKNGADVVSKDEWQKNASLSLSGANEEDWNFSAVTASIRGRGNSTWAQPKKPYALKLDKKREIMGMPGHKRWVLIANYLDNSFMRNCMAFYLSRQLGVDYTVCGEFVMLNLNGADKGLYWLGEAIKPDKNRVDIDEDEDFLLELDVYYDEVWKFKSAVKQLPYMIKNDDAMTDGRLETLQEKIAVLEQALYPVDGGAPDESYLRMLDIDSWAKFYLINELMSNGELGHPKSCYLTFTTADSLLKAGPVWDFDWASLSQTGCTLTNTLYYDALFKSPTFRARLKEIWDECCGNINIAGEIKRLRDTIDEAQLADAAIWGTHLDPSGIPRDGFDAYVDFLQETLCKKYAAVDSMIQQL